LRLACSRPPRFAPPVRWLEKIERRLDWVHFEGLFKYLTFLGVIAYACQWARKDIADQLDFDRDRILAGEVWRVFTFIFSPIGRQGFTVWGAVMMFIAVRVAFLMSDSLENVWGSTRTTLYLLVGWAGIAAAQFVFGSGGSLGGLLYYSSVFLAFATLFPKVEFALFFLIPVEVRLLGWITGVLLVLSAVTVPGAIIIVGPALLPYALWVLPDVIQGRKSLVKAVQRRRKFNVDSLPEIGAFHRCEICQRTERDSEDLQFFTLPDGKEYCEDHLPKQG